MPIAGRTEISQKISSHFPAFIHPSHGPIARSRTKFTSDHDPEAMPDISAACSRGKEYEPTFNATIWKPPPINVDSEINAIAIDASFVHVVAPSVSDSATSRRNIPT